MKVQVVTVDRAGGKKLCVQVVYQVNGKTKKQNKQITLNYLQNNNIPHIIQNNTIVSY